MNRIIDAIREGNKSRLVIATGDSPLVPAYQTIAIPFDIGVKKLLIKSLEVTCSKQIDFRVEFFEESSLSRSRYNSGIVRTENYDVLDLPYVDQEGTTQIYFLIHNESEYDATYSLEVRGIEMK